MTPVLDAGVLFFRDSFGIMLDTGTDLWYNGYMMKKNLNELANLSGWIGMILIHGATLPTTLSVILGYSTALPPLSMVLLIWSGLFLFLVSAIANKNMLYIVSNSIGFVFQSVLLSLIVFKGI
jgi:uncharacterized protein with PQ loop repeat